MHLRQAVLRAARTRPVGWLLRKVWTWIPHKKLMQFVHESQHWQAFRHPQPVDALHLLLLPRQPYRDLQSLGQAEAAVLKDLFALVNSLIEKFQLGNRGYRLITNGGLYQEVEVLHFHLVADRASEGTDT